jgi:hypothetical protein
VFIGTDYGEPDLRAALEEALVTDEEWTTAGSLADPFPAEGGEEATIRTP